MSLLKVWGIIEGEATQRVITTAHRFRDNPGTPGTGASPGTLPASLWPGAVF